MKEDMLEHHNFGMWLERRMKDNLLADELYGRWFLMCESCSFRGCNLTACVNRTSIGQNKNYTTLSVGSSMEHGVHKVVPTDIAYSTADKTDVNSDPQQGDETISNFIPSMNVRLKGEKPQPMKSCVN
jgi:hypothetical protein